MLDEEYSVESQPCQSCSRRQMLSRSALGFGGLALASMLTEEALAAGIKKFVVKPTKRHELVTAIRTVLDEQEG